MPAMITITDTGISARNGMTGVTGMRDGKEKGRMRGGSITMRDTGKMTMINARMSFHLPPM